MRKLQYIYLFGLSLLAIACNKDDEDIPLTEANLIGVWKMTENYVKDGKITQTTSEGVTLNASISSISKDIRITFIFRDNPKEIISNGSSTTITTVTIFGNEEITTTKTEITSSGNLTTRVTATSVSGKEGTDTDTTTYKNPTWSLQDNILSINEEGKTNNNEIISFDGNTLHLHLMIDENIQLFGDTIKITGSLYTTFVKQ